SVVVGDPRFGAVRLTGRLRDRGEGDLLVVVHGLGGCTESHYARRAAAAAERAGLSCLRMNLRGCDRSGEDFYHAGLTSDLAAALASPETAHFRRVLLLGYSLGGHVALRFAAVEEVPRLAAVAAVCAPLDLALSAAAIDAPALAVYKRYLVRHLKEIYAPVAARRPELTPFDAVRGIGSLREWDDRVVAPRHGFASGADYYARASVRPALAARHPLEVHWLRRAGHCGFPEDVDLALRAGGSNRLEDQTIDWL